MIRRTALKALVSLSALSFLLINNPQKSYAGSGGGSGGNDSGGSLLNERHSNGGGSSSDNGGGSSPNSPSGPDDSLSGSRSNDTNSQNELVERLNQSLESDGLETVTPDNMQSTLDSFK